MLRVSYLKFSVAKAKSDHSTRTAKVHKVRIADIDVHRTSGRIKLSFHKSHKDRVEYYAVKPKRSREAYKRQYNRSALTKPEHYQLIEELLAEHPNSLIYRVHLKGDINATADNAHVFVLTEKKHLHVLLDTLTHRRSALLSEF